MAERHIQYGVSSTADIMYALYQFITDGTQDVVDFVVDNSQTALWVDDSEGTGTPDLYKSSVSSAAAFGTNSFMVVEVQFNNPGGRAWQAKITKSGTGTIDIEVSPNGGWTIANATSGATDTFGANPTTGDLQWHGTSLAAGDQLYVSSCDLDTYGVSDKYGYLRAVFWDDSGGAFDDGFYVGGYIPLDETNDTDPLVLLCNKPELNSGTTSGSRWGRNISTTNNNRIPLEDGQATSSLATTYACISSNQAVTDNDHGQTRNGVETEHQIFINGVGTDVCVGYWGEFTALGIASSVGNRTANNAGTRMVVENMAIRWNP